MTESVAIGQQTQEEEISGKLQQTPVVQWKKQQKPRQKVE